MMSKHIQFSSEDIFLGEENKEKIFLNPDNIDNEFKLDKTQQDKVNVKISTLKAVYNKKMETEEQIEKNDNDSEEKVEEEETSHSDNSVSDNDNDKDNDMEDDTEDDDEEDFDSIDNSDNEDDDDENESIGSNDNSSSSDIDNDVPSNLKDRNSSTSLMIFNKSLLSSSSSNQRFLPSPPSSRPQSRSHNRPPRILVRHTIKSLSLPSSLVKRNIDSSNIFLNSSHFLTTPNVRSQRSKCLSLVSRAGRNVRSDLTDSGSGDRIVLSNREWSSDDLTQQLYSSIFQFLTDSTTHLLFSPLPSLITLNSVDHLVEQTLSSRPSDCLKPYHLHLAPYILSHLHTLNQTGRTFTSLLELSQSLFVSLHVNKYQFKIFQSRILKLQHSNSNKLFNLPIDMWKIIERGEEGNNTPEILKSISNNRERVQPVNVDEWVEAIRGAHVKPKERKKILRFLLNSSQSLFVNLSCTKSYDSKDNDISFALVDKIIECSSCGNSTSEFMKFLHHQGKEFVDFDSLIKSLKDLKREKDWLRHIISTPIQIKNLHHSLSSTTKSFLQIKGTKYWTLHETQRLIEKSGLTAPFIRYYISILSNTTHFTADCQIYNSVDEFADFLSLYHSECQLILESLCSYMNLQVKKHVILLSKIHFHCAPFDLNRILFESNSSPADIVRSIYLWRQSNIQFNNWNDFINGLAITSKAESIRTDRIFVNNSLNQADRVKFDNRIILHELYYIIFTSRSALFEGNFSPSLADVEELFETCQSDYFLIYHLFNLLEIIDKADKKQFLPSVKELSIALQLQQSSIDADLLTLHSSIQKNFELLFNFPYTDFILKAIFAICKFNLRRVFEYLDYYNNECFIWLSEIECYKSILKIETQRYFNMNKIEVTLFNHPDIITNNYTVNSDKKISKDLDIRIKNNNNQTHNIENLDKPSLYSLEVYESISQTLPFTVISRFDHSLLPPSKVYPSIEELIFTLRSLREYKRRLRPSSKLDLQNYLNNRYCHWNLIEVSLNDQQLAIIYSLAGDDLFEYFHAFSSQNQTISTFSDLYNQLFIKVENSKNNLLSYLKSRKSNIFTLSSIRFSLNISDINHLLHSTNATSTEMMRRCQGLEKEGRNFKSITELIEFIKLNNDKQNPGDAHIRPGCRIVNGLSEVLFPPIVRLDDDKKDLLNYLFHPDTFLLSPHLHLTLHKKSTEFQLLFDRNIPNSLLLLYLEHLNNQLIVYDSIEALILSVDKIDDEMREELSLIGKFLYSVVWLKEEVKSHLSERLIQILAIQSQAGKQLFTQIKKIQSNYSNQESKEPIFFNSLYDLRIFVNQQINEERLKNSKEWGDIMSFLSSSGGLLIKPINPTSKKELISFLHDMQHSPTTIIEYFRSLKDTGLRYKSLEEIKLDHDLLELYEKEDLKRIRSLLLNNSVTLFNRTYKEEIMSNLQLIFNLYKKIGKCCYLYLLQISKLSHIQFSTMTDLAEYMAQEVKKEMDHINLYQQTINDTDKIFSIKEEVDTVRSLLNSIQLDEKIRECLSDDRFIVKLLLLVPSFSVLKFVVSEALDNEIFDKSVLNLTDNSPSNDSNSLFKCVEAVILLESAKFGKYCDSILSKLISATFYRSEDKPIHTISTIQYLCINSGAGYKTLDFIKQFEVSPTTVITTFHQLLITIRSRYQVERAAEESKLADSTCKETLLSYLNSPSCSIIHLPLNLRINKGKLTEILNSLNTTAATVLSLCQSSMETANKGSTVNLEQSSHQTGKVHRSDYRDQGDISLLAHFVLLLKEWRKDQKIKSDILLQQLLSLPMISLLHSTLHLVDLTELLSLEELVGSSALRQSISAVKFCYQDEPFQSAKDLTESIIYQQQQQIIQIKQFLNNHELGIVSSDLQTEDKEKEQSSRSITDSDVEMSLRLIGDGELTLQIFAQLINQSHQRLFTQEEFRQAICSLMKSYDMDYQPIQTRDSLHTEIVSDDYLSPSQSNNLSKEKEYNQLRQYFESADCSLFTAPPTLSPQNLSSLLDLSMSSSSSALLNTDTRVTNLIDYCSSLNRMGQKFRSFPFLLRSIKKLAEKERSIRLLISQFFPYCSNEQAEIIFDLLQDQTTENVVQILQSIAQTEESDRNGNSCNSIITRSSSTSANKFVFSDLVRCCEKEKKKVLDYNHDTLIKVIWSGENSLIPSPVPTPAPFQHLNALLMANFGSLTATLSSLNRLSRVDNCYSSIEELIEAVCDIGEKIELASLVEERRLTLKEAKKRDIYPLLAVADKNIWEKFIYFKLKISTTQVQFFSQPFYLSFNKIVNGIEEKSMTSSILHVNEMDINSSDNKEKSKLNETKEFQVVFDPLILSFEGLCGGDKKNEFNLQLKQVSGDNTSDRLIAEISTCIDLMQEHHLLSIPFLLRYANQINKEYSTTGLPPIQLFIQSISTCFNTTNGILLSPQSRLFTNSSLCLFRIDIEGEILDDSIKNVYWSLESWMDDKWLVKVDSRPVRVENKISKFGLSIYQTDYICNGDYDIPIRLSISNASTKQKIGECQTSMRTILQISGVNRIILFTLENIKPATLPQQLICSAYLRVTEAHVFSPFDAIDQQAKNLFSTGNSDLTSMEEKRQAFMLWLCQGGEYSMNPFSCAVRSC